MNTNACVYRLTFPNGKSYIGATRKSAQDRLVAHFYHASCVLNGRHTRHTQPVHFAIAKYGQENVLLETLLIADIEQCFKYEMLAITQFNTRSPNGYNLTDGGEGVTGKDAITRAKISASRMGNTYGKGKIPSAEKREKLRIGNLGKIVSLETRKKISDSNKGKIISQAHRESMRKKLQGRVFTDEWKAKISAALKGHTYSDESKAKMSAARRGKKASPETCEKRRASMLATIASKKAAIGVDIPRPHKVMV